MSRFRPSKVREMPSLNMTALPDMIFTFLFFFMMVTTMRPIPVKTQMNLPTAQELQKLQERSLVVYVMAGQDTPIQLNHDLVTLDEMPTKLQALKDSVPESDRDKMIAVLKLDKDLPMGLVNDIKHHLRQARILTVHYSAMERG